MSMGLHSCGLQPQRSSAIILSKDQRNVIMPRISMYVISWKPFATLRACLHGRRVTLLEGLLSLEGQKTALLYMCRVTPGALLPVKARKPETIMQISFEVKALRFNFVYVVEKHVSGFGRLCPFLCLFGGRLASWFITTCVYIFQWLIPSCESFRSRPSPFTRTISPEWSIPASKLI